MTDTAAHKKIEGLILVVFAHRGDTKAYSMALVFAPSFEGRETSAAQIPDLTHTGARCLTFIHADLAEAEQSIIKSSTFL